jgi:hypothetical protein
MHEFFWFFLGGFVYLGLDKITSFYKKMKFIQEVKILAFQLIGIAYEQVVFSTTMKYISLENSDMDKEKIKLYKNADEDIFTQWKREVVSGLKAALPSIYRDALEIEDWNDIMKALDSHYKNVLRKNKVVSLLEENEKKEFD